MGGSDLRSEEGQFGGVFGIRFFLAGVILTCSKFIHFFQKNPEPPQKNLGERFSGRLQY